MKIKKQLFYYEWFIKQSCDLQSLEVLNLVINYPLYIVCKLKMRYYM